MILKIIQYQAISLLFFSSFAFQISANQCKKEQNAYQKVQQQMKQPYSFSKGERLRAKERALFSLLQSCFNSKTRNVSRKKRTDKKNINKKTTKLKTIKLLSTNVKQKEKTTYEGLAPNKSLIIKGKFTGQMQNAWLKYYKRPKECNLPKSTASFAWCIEHKNESATAFKEQWQKKHKVDLRH